LVDGEKASGVMQVAAIHARSIAKLEGPFRIAGSLDQRRKWSRMSEVERLRDKVEKCRQLALMCGDAETERRLVALANEFEAKAVRAGAQLIVNEAASCK
jgi:hypothetical protein